MTTTSSHAAEVTLLDGETVSARAFTSGKNGLSYTKEGEESPTLIPWHRISPVGLSGENAALQQNFARYYIQRAAELSANEPERGAKVLSLIEPMISNMEPQVQDQVGWSSRADPNHESAPQQDIASIPESSEPDSPVDSSDSRMSFPSPIPSAQSQSADTLVDQAWEKFAIFTTTLKENRGFYRVISWGLIIGVIGTLISRIRARKRPSSDKLKLALREIRWGIAFTILSFLSFLALVYFGLYEPKTDTGYETYFLIGEGFLYVVITIGMAKKSRIAATSMLVYFILSMVYEAWLDPAAMASNTVTIVIMVIFATIFLRTMFATFKFHRLTRPPKPKTSGSKTPPPLPATA
ncbi:MAG: hypothetical protein AAGA96_06720 [Verrucomicrobiota bacterium]